MAENFEGHSQYRAVDWQEEEHHRDAESLTPQHRQGDSTPPFQLPSENSTRASTESVISESLVERVARSWCRGSTRGFQPLSPGSNPGERTILDLKRC